MPTILQSETSVLDPSNFHERRVHNRPPHQPLVARAFTHLEIVGHGGEHYRGITGLVDHIDQDALVLTQDPEAPRRAVARRNMGKSRASLCLQVQVRSSDGQAIEDISLTMYDYIGRETNGAGTGVRKRADV